MKIKPFVSFVVLLRNAGDALPGLLTELDRFLAEQFETYEVILVDNASEDGTTERLNVLSTIDRSRYTLITLAWKHGIDRAMLSGVELAIGDFVYEIEGAYLPQDLALLTQLYHTSTEGFDLVTAAPEGSTPLTSRWFYRVFNQIAYLNLELSTEHIRLVSRRVLNATLKLRERIPYRKVLYRQSGFPSRSLTYQPNRVLPPSQDSLGEKANLALDIFVAFSDLGFRASVSLSLFFLLVSALLGVYALLVFLTNQQTVSGWTTVMLFLSFGFSGMFLLFTIFSKYLMMIQTELNQRPQYTYRAIERLSNLRQTVQSPTKEQP